MEIIDTPIEDVFLLKPNVFRDERGYFFESYHQKRLHDHGLDCQFVQDNEAKSNKGVLRGLHYQRGTHAQAKLVRVVTGSVYDVVVDIRPESITYGNWFGAELSSENGFQLFVPKGLAHGYLVLEDNTIFAYKCDQYYDKGSEGGIKFDDPNLNIKWPSMDEAYIVSAKDSILPYFGDHFV